MLAILLKLLVGVRSVSICVNVGIYLKSLMCLRLGTIVLATLGLERFGLDCEISGILLLKVMLPPVKGKVRGSIVGMIHQWRNLILAEYMHI